MVKTIKSSQKIAQLNARIEELEGAHKRVLADYLNQDRRHKEQESQIVRMASAVLLEKLLVSVDALELAQKHLNDKGLQMVIDQLASTLSGEGLEPIDTIGKDFDPLSMDCIEVVPGPKNIVVETISKGYSLFDKVLRPSKVKVGSGINFHSHENENLSNISGK